MAHSPEETQDGAKWRKRGTEAEWDEWDEYAEWDESDEEAAEAEKEAETNTTHGVSQLTYKTTRQEGVVNQQDASCQVQLSPVIDRRPKKVRFNQSKPKPEENSNGHNKIASCRADPSPVFFRHPTKMELSESKPKLEKNVNGHNTMVPQCGMTSNLCMSKVTSTNPCCPQKRVYTVHGPDLPPPEKEEYFTEEKLRIEEYTSHRVPCGYRKTIYKNCCC